eukprot:CAMPEP_0172619676 /NCGR_PEP_ID=MMETSP1068-20121228/95899_1 /TAXON_ID=35684 /ORGANISM="Pseudopedinella elastica, Strain CCMP716" /LENGTH=121 /DNA_ID=CAMNT_0013426557 /DNA_START=95 /DNA_END=456 /DNA_ORIENTATION=-
MSTKTKSKLDLLKRYGSASASDDKGDSKKKKRRKKSSASRTSGDRGSDNSGLDAAPSEHQVNAAWEDAEGEDEMPVILDESGAVVNAKKIGMWGAVNEERQAQPRRDIPDASPPRRKTGGR